MKGVLISGRASELEPLLLPRLPADVCLDVYSDASQVTSSASNGAEFVVGAPDEIVKVLPSLEGVRWVQSTWAGVRPFLDCSRRDYQLTGLKGVFGPSMSEYVLGWSLALHRSILKRAAATSWDARLDSGLHDKQLGIAGAGDIGVFTAVRCAPFFTSVRGLNSDGRACEGFDHCYARLDIDEFATGLDVLVLILPDTPATDGLFDEDVLARLNHGALVINAGRANSLETGALTRLLRSGHIGASVLDVFENEPLSASDSLWDEPNLYVTSHTAAPTPMSAIVDVFLDNLERYRCGAELQGLIDFDRGY